MEYNRFPDSNHIFFLPTAGMDYNLALLRFHPVRRSTHTPTQVIVLILIHCFVVNLNDDNIYMPVSQWYPQERAVRTRILVLILAYSIAVRSFLSLCIDIRGPKISPFILLSRSPCEAPLHDHRGVNHQCNSQAHVTAAVFKRVRRKAGGIKLMVVDTPLLSSNHHGQVQSSCCHCHLHFPC